MQIIIPPFLKTGDTIGIVASARSVVATELDIAIETFKSWGLDVVLGKNIFGKQHQFSGTDIDRGGDLQYMLDNKDIKALFFARGGYGSVRTLQHVDFSNFAHNPKWLCGYSDVTVFHSFINKNCSVASLHSPMPFNIGKDNYNPQSIEYTRQTLFGQPPEYQSNTTELNINGVAEGELIGGNLSVLYSLQGTPAQMDTTNKILFLEDLDEYLYHVDRMMMNLKYSGYLSHIKGLIVGSMSDMHDNQTPFGKNAMEIIANVVSDLNIPVWFDFPAGHEYSNHPLILGSKVKLEVTNICKLTTYI